MQAASLSPELDAFKSDIERACIDGLQLAGMSDSELCNLAASVGGSRFKDELRAQLQRVKEMCEAQVATMRHFKE
jgi:hypothetical protein